MRAGPAGRIVIADEMQAALERSTIVYQIHLRAHASKLAMRVARIQRRADIHPRRQRFSLRDALAGLARLAALRVPFDASIDTAEWCDPRDPRNW